MIDHRFLHQQRICVVCRVKKAKRHYFYVEDLVATMYLNVCHKCFDYVRCRIVFLLPESIKFRNLVIVGLGGRELQNLEWRKNRIL